MPDIDLGLLSIVIPVCTERDSLAALFAEIAEVARGLDVKVEVIFVDDGSKDDSWSIIRELAASDERVRGIRFRRNFGKAAALQAGFNSARGAIVMTLDADLQDDPHEISNFLAAIRGGLDVVSGWKKIRLDPWHKVFPSRVFNRLVGWMTGVHLHDHNCGFKAYRTEVLREVRIYGELHRFVPIFASNRGFKIGELVINHRPRKFGHSKYRWQRFVKGFLDLFTVHFLTKFGRRPQHLIGSYGLTFGCGGLLGLSLFMLLVYVSFDSMTRTGFAFCVLGFALSFAAMIVGGQFFTTGLLAELVVARKMTEQEPFSIAELTPSKSETA